MVAAMDAVGVFSPLLCKSGLRTGGTASIVSIPGTCLQLV
jgi:hypothetical protein